MAETVFAHEDFPNLATKVYLNTAAEGIPPRQVRAALARYVDDKALGEPGREAHFKQLAATKQEMALALGMAADEVALCSCTSEAFSLLAQSLDFQPGDEVIVNDLEFPSGRTPFLNSAVPLRPRLWQSRAGRLEPDDLRELLGPKTRLVAVSLVSFYNGALLDLRQTLAVLRRHSDALLALDVTQALGRIPLALDDVDFVVSSTHKWILGSHGGGIVGIPRDKAAHFHFRSGGWFNFDNVFAGDPLSRPVPLEGAAAFAQGMPNFPAVYAVGEALAYIRDHDVASIHGALKPLITMCREGLEAMYLEMLTPSGEAAGILSFRHPKADEILRRLKEMDVFIMGDCGRLRVSIHGYNNESQVSYFLDMLQQVIQEV